MWRKEVTGLVLGGGRRSSDAHQNRVEWVLAADSKRRVEGQSNQAKNEGVE